MISELPLSAFGDSETRELDLKDTDRIDVPRKAPESEERPSVVVASIVGVGDE